MQKNAELPLAHNLLNATKPNVMTAQDAVDRWCLQHGFDAVLVTAQDAFLSEYTPLPANHRYALSGFSGSTGDGLFITRALAQTLATQGRFQLFVDGRYHLQADQETKSDEVHVHKFSLASGLDEALFSWLRAQLPSGSRLAVDLQRISWNRWHSLEKLANEKSFALIGLTNGGVASALPDIQGWRTQRAIKAIPEKFTGRSPEKNLRDLRAELQTQLGHENYIYATCMTDDAAWLINARAYHLPNLSSVLAYTLITANKCIVHLPEESESCPIEIPNLPAEIKFTRGPLSEALAELSEGIGSNDKPKAICFSGRAMNAALPKMLGDFLPAASLHDNAHSLEQIRAQKTAQELNSIRRSFLRSSQAIARTLRFAKDHAQRGKPLSEQDLADKIKAEYAAEGALELSFKTISGFAENGAVIHYSTPNQKKLASKGDLLLLDSGAYYEEGFATDCTRVVLFGESSAQSQPWQKEIYTLTLKSCLAGLRAQFALNTACREIDALARGPIQGKGYDYAHGTGHGIGIHVHESGIRLSPVSQYQFTENAVVSVEPGIYLAGQGGVRIENVAIVRPTDSENKSFTHGFENVVFVGYDWDLIDLNLLSDEDKKDLAAYERKCQSLGTNVTTCPLL